jgi:RimJ/RimL family protein N-acetyltransferase
MDIVIRDTAESDLPGIFRIVTDPLVQPHQYRLTRRDTIDGWKQQLFGDRKNGPMLIKCTTVVRYNEIIGHISHNHYEAHGQKLCYCGWNLAPAYWGRGIATIALSQLFDSFFGPQQVDAVISDCFSNNQRCVRVLQKLNYEPVGIAPYHRLVILIVNRCLHWIRRFQLTADRWHARSHKTAT